MKVVDITNCRFGRLIVVSLATPSSGRAMWNCQCDCGGQGSFRAKYLLCGDTKSCGCLKVELIQQRFRTHGLSQTLTYRVWKSMRQRCSNHNDANFDRYGGRGITVCERWQNSFSAFLEDMGEAPNQLTLERIDNNKGYCKDNCRWETRAEQARNTSMTRLLDFDGKSMCVSDWAQQVAI